MPYYRKRPVIVEARQWLGRAEEAGPIIDWILEGGGTARYHEDGRELADPDCPTPQFHRTRRYCPNCPFTDDSEHISIDTFEGTMRVEPGDWIIKGVQGEFYPCKPGIFEATYEEVSYEEPPRILTIDLDSGAWLNAAVLTPGDATRVAASVLPGAPEEAIDRFYSDWLNSDPEPADPEFVASETGTEEDA